MNWKESRLRWWLVPISIALGTLALDGAIVAVDIWSRSAGWSSPVANEHRAANAQAETPQR